MKLIICFLFVLVSFSSAQIKFPEDDGLAPGLKALPVPAGASIAANQVRSVTARMPAVLPGQNGNGLPPPTTSTTPTSKSSNSQQSYTFPSALPTPPGGL